MVKAETVQIDMDKYVNSEEIVEQCEGCKKVFDWHGGEGTVVVEKCLAYISPAAKWPYEGQKFAMHTVTVRAGKSTAEKELPIIQKICPLASHVQVEEVINTVSKVHAGQGKTKAGGNR